MDRLLSKYLRTRGLTRALEGGCEGAGPKFECAVVIPAYRESSFLPGTLESLAGCAAGDLSTTLVLVVVNNRCSRDLPADRVRCEEDAVADNRETLRWLRGTCPRELRVAWIDASSPGRELPGHGGVGMARKLGADSLLAALYEDGGSGLCAAVPPDTFTVGHLDADTLVEPDYLSCADALLASGAAGGVIRVEHQAADTAAAQRAIDAYEQFMLHYAFGLRWAGSPYGFHTVGSAMLSTARAYVQAGGVPAKRQAGEDFYFLQQVAKVGGVALLPDTTVCPSARPSLRVPFGTGPRIAAAVAAPEPGQMTYPVLVFEALRDLFSRVVRGWSARPDCILHGLACEAVADVLSEQDFETSFARFQEQYGTAADVWRAFNEWFDGLATFRLVRRLADTYGEVPLAEGLSALADRAGWSGDGADAETAAAYCRRCYYGLAPYRGLLSVQFERMRQGVDIDQTGG